MKTPTVLVAGVLPLTAPWNGGDKVLARSLIEQDQSTRFIVVSGTDDSWSNNVTALRVPRPAHTPSRRERARMLAQLVTHARQADVIHVVASLDRPNAASAHVLRLVRHLARRPILHTAPSLGAHQLGRRHFFGDLTVVVSEWSLGVVARLGVAVERTFPPVAVPIVGRDAVERARRTYMIDGTAILYPTHFGSRNGVDEALRALRLVRDRTGEGILVLACRPVPKQDIAQEAAAIHRRARELGVDRHVRVLTQLPDIHAVMHACRAAALVPGQMSSKVDLPLSLLEAALIGLPVIVSDAPPIREACMGDGGFRVRYGDVRGLARAFSVVVTDEVRSRSMGAAARAAVSEACSPRRVAEAYAERYARLHARRHSRPASR